MGELRHKFRKISLTSAHVIFLHGADSLPKLTFQLNLAPKLTFDAEHRLTQLYRISYTVYIKPRVDSIILTFDVPSLAGRESLLGTM